MCLYVYRLYICSLIKNSKQQITLFTKLILLSRHSGLKGVNIWRATPHCLNACTLYKPLCSQTLLTVSVAQVVLPYLVVLFCCVMPKNKATSQGLARSQPVCSATHGCLRGGSRLSSNAPGSRPRWTAISLSAPACVSVPSPPDNSSVPTSSPSCQLDLFSMTMDSLVSVIQNQISLLTQTGAVSMSPGPQPTSLPQPVVAPLAPIQPVPVSMPLTPLPATLPPSSSIMLAGTCHVLQMLHTHTIYTSLY